MNIPNENQSQTINYVENEPSHGQNVPYKQLESAKATFTKRPDGTHESYIEHAPMHGMTPEILIWFFKHLDCYTTFNPYSSDFTGPEIAVYRLWHLRDHVALYGNKPGEDAEAAISLGSTFSIEEKLLLKHPISAPSLVYDLYYDFEDGTRIGDGSSPNGANGHEVNKGNFGFWLIGPAGIRIGYLDHYFQILDNEQNTMAFQTRFVAGRPNNHLLNFIVHRIFAAQLMKDWILHNVEESGQTEKIAPALYNNPDKVFRKSQLTARVVT